MGSSSEKSGHNHTGVLALGCNQAIFSSTRHVQGLYVAHQSSVRIFAGAPRIPSEISHILCPIRLSVPSQLLSLEHTTCDRWSFSNMLSDTFDCCAGHP